MFESFFISIQGGCGGAVHTLDFHRGRSLSTSEFQGREFAENSGLTKLTTIFVPIPKGVFSF